MTRVLFVHGTGVRRAAFDRAMALVRTGLQEALPGAEVLECFWGETEGVRLHADGLSIPDYGATRGAPGEEEDDLGRWARLYEDPEGELRLLAAREGAEERVPGRRAPGEVDLGRLARLVPGGATATALAEFDLAGAFADARDAVTGSETAERAAERISGTELRTALARAVVARLLRDRADRLPGAPWPTARERDRLVQALFLAIGGPDRGVGDVLAGLLKGAGARIVTLCATGRRGALMDGASPAVGDILLYQARGQRLRDFIARRLEETGAQWIVAHSLGGIASFELLAGGGAPPLDGLVTVGSQAPYLYELDALATVRFAADVATGEERLPQDFPRWINVYDRRDLLSYWGKLLFGTRCEDVLVDGGQPFPASHSAYWSNPEVWRAIAKAIRGEGR